MRRVKPDIVESIIAPKSGDYRLVIAENLLQNELARFAIGGTHLKLNIEGGGLMAPTRLWWLDSNGILIDKLGDAIMAQPPATECPIYIIKLYSDEALDLFYLEFSLMQVNIYEIMVHLWLESNDRLVGEDREIRSQLDHSTAVLDNALANAAGRLVSASISVGLDHLAPKALQVPVYSDYDWLYLEHIRKLDRIMLLLDAMVVHELVSKEKADRKKARLKREVEKVANLVRDLHKPAKEKRNQLSLH